MTSRLTPLLLPALLLPATAHGYALMGGHWNTADGPVEYTITAAGSDDVTADDSEIKAIQHAFQTWECVLCSDLQFRYMGDGPAVTGPDGHNRVAFIEDSAAWEEASGASAQGDTLGVDLHYETGEDVVWSDSDIVFNGASESWTWTTSESGGGVDVESIALHEIGHFNGLDHSCSNQEDPATCLPAEQSVMNPGYPGGLTRDPHKDDTDGLCAIYKQSKAQCSGKQRLKESCEKDCDCEDNLFCVPDPINAGRMCSRKCTTSNATCPKGTGCGLGADSGGESGFCVRNPDPDRPAVKADGMVCARDGDCASSSCRRVRAINKYVCYRHCAGESDCGLGYTCVEDACLLASSNAGVVCPSGDVENHFPLPLPPGAPEPPTPPGCSSSAPAGLWACWALALVVALRRRATSPRSTR